MAIISLDAKRYEHGLGSGNILKVVGDPFESPVDRLTPGLGTTPIVLGNEDGYDVSSITGIRLWYDILIGDAGYVDLFIAPMAANPGGTGIPVAVDSQPAAQIAFLPDTPVLSSASGPLVPALTPLRFSADRRGSLTLPRNSLVIRFEAAVDIAGPSTAEISLAVQSVLDGGGE